ncbi:hypothetical protein N9P65_01950 [Alphaproteobacteria bacterium]|nr:hypothetical protein [Alphaproteobacteria bacterium]
MTAIATISLMTAGCQLLIDNRQTGKASVVVVPTDEWDKLRGQQMRTDIATSIVDELLTNQAAIGAATPAEDIIAPINRPSPIAVDGSQTIQFSNHTNSQLAGCSSIGIIEVRHTGTMDNALIILKNEAYRLNTNILVPLTINQADADHTASANIKIEARMMKCPLKLARGN